MGLDAVLPHRLIVARPGVENGQWSIASRRFEVLQCCRDTAHNAGNRAVVEQSQGHRDTGEHPAVWVVIRDGPLRQQIQLLTQLGNWSWLSCSRAYSPPRVPQARLPLAASRACGRRSRGSADAPAEAQHLVAVQPDEPGSDALGRQPALCDPPTDRLLIHAVKVGGLPDAGSGRQVCPRLALHGLNPSTDSRNDRELKRGTLATRLG